MNPENEELPTMFRAVTHVFLAAHAYERGFQP
jgi:hypothetical protein